MNIDRNITHLQVSGAGGRGGRRAFGARGPRMFPQEDPALTAVVFHQRAERQIKILPGNGPCILCWVPSPQGSAEHPLDDGSDW